MDLEIAISKIPKKIIFITILLLILILCFSNIVNGQIIYVGYEENEDFRNIQDAIDNVTDPNTIIYVKNGVYNENIHIHRELKLIGLNKPIINGIVKEGTTVKIYSDNITFDGFDITCYDYINNTKGIHITSNNIVISNCSISNLNRGVYLYNSKNNIFNNNKVENCNLNGFDLINSGYNELFGNKIFNNSNYGINLWNASYNILEENIIKNNQACGVYFASSSNNSFLKNNIRENKIVGISLNIASDYNLLYYNNFINNSQQAEDDCLNLWYDQKTKTGNYWSNYLSINPEISQENITWSEPFNISLDGSIQDIYPLVDLYEIINIQIDDPANNNLGSVDDNNLIYLPIVLIILPVVFFYLVLCNKKRKR